MLGGSCKGCGVLDYRCDVVNDELANERRADRNKRYDYAVKKTESNDVRPGFPDDVEDGRDVL